MPFYEYQCQACGAQVEVLQKISDAPLKKCPECAKAKLVKLVSAPVFRLKGSGWYETDFKGDQDTKRNLVGDDKEAKPAADAKDAGTDAKPEAAAADKKAEPKAAEPAAATKPAAGAASAARKAKPVSKPARKPAPKPVAKRAKPKAGSRR
jgi:putative FmdB family regulatory protein